MYIFTAIKNQSGIGFIVDALLDSRTVYKLWIDTGSRFEMLFIANENTFGSLLRKVVVRPDLEEYLYLIRLAKQFRGK